MRSSNGEVNLVHTERCEETGSILFADIRDEILRMREGDNRFFLRIFDVLHLVKLHDIHLFLVAVYPKGGSVQEYLFIRRGSINPVIKGFQLPDNSRWVYKEDKSPIREAIAKSGLLLNSLFTTCPELKIYIGEIK
jgi:hypothetical protein